MAILSWIYLPEETLLPFFLVYVAFCLQPEEEVSVVFLLQTEGG